MNSVGLKGAAGGSDLGLPPQTTGKTAPTSCLYPSQQPSQQRACRFRVRRRSALCFLGAVRGPSAHRGRGHAPAMRLARGGRPLLPLPVQLLLQGGVALLLGGAGSAGASTHSLHYFITAVWEPGRRLPLSTSLSYVDDQLLGRYDRDTDQCVPQSSWVEEISHDDANFWARSTGGDFALSLVTDLLILKNVYNQSRGVHTLQVFSGCELSEDNHTTREFVKYGYNGRDFLSLDMATLTWTAMDEETKPIKRKWDAEPERGEFWGQFLRETCVEGLHIHLRYGTESLLRIDPPVVRVTRRAGSDDLETLFCQLYGFYPKEIEVTWRKDGEDQKPETLTGGVVPNSDGTYHTWLSIDVDPREKDRYRCHVEHDSLPEPLNLAWEEPASVSNLGLIVGISLGAVAVLVQVGAGVVFYIGRSQKRSYQGALASDSG